MNKLFLPVVKIFQKKWKFEIRKPGGPFWPRRGLRPSLRWGQKWSSFWSQMLCFTKGFLAFQRFWSLLGPGGAAPPGARKGDGRMYETQSSRNPTFIFLVRTKRAVTHSPQCKKSNILY